MNLFNGPGYGYDQFSPSVNYSDYDYDQQFTHMRNSHNFNDLEKELNYELLKQRLKLKPKSNESYIESYTEPHNEKNTKKNAKNSEPADNQFNIFNKNNQHLTMILFILLIVMMVQHINIYYLHEDVRMLIMKKT